LRSLSASYAGFSYKVLHMYDVEKHSALLAGDSFCLCQLLTHQASTFRQI